ncbi:MAG TPA: ATP-dependent 6-phosphofructokinase [Planctomycetota bacterium]|nr:ATP-dependent 6-phosphofructokinase [Planctomycetota bacterium]
MKRVGVLTAGGDCPGLNAVIRAVTKSLINKHNIEVVGIRDGFLGLIDKRAIMLSSNDVSGILTQGGTILGTTNKANPFKFHVERNGQIVVEDLSDDVIANAEKMGIEALICIGGDGTQHISHELGAKGMHVIGVPKTIDNDLRETDLTFGHDTAVSIATDAVDRIHTTAMSHHRVMVIETMGRNAGWIALNAGIAGGGDIILIPEIPYKLDAVKKKIEDRVRNGRLFSIIVVAEGARPAGGHMVIRERVSDPTEPIRLGGIGQKVADDVERVTGIESRVTVLGHLQRGGTPTAFDRILATRFGALAADLVADGIYGKMTALKGSEIVPVPLEAAVAGLKLVDPESSIVKAAREVGTSFGDET